MSPMARCAAHAARRPRRYGPGLWPSPLRPARLTCTGSARSLKYLQLVTTSTRPNTITSGGLVTPEEQEDTWYMAQISTDNQNSRVNIDTQFIRK